MVSTALPCIPKSRAACKGELPTSLLSLDTTVSAGWETIAQNTPAIKQKTYSIKRSIDFGLFTKKL